MASQVQSNQLPVQSTALAPSWRTLPNQKRCKLPNPYHNLPIIQNASGSNDLQHAQFMAIRLIVSKDVPCIVIWILRILQHGLKSFFQFFCGVFRIYHAFFWFPGWRMVFWNFFCCGSQGWDCISWKRMNTVAVALALLPIKSPKCWEYCKRRWRQ